MTEQQESSRLSRESRPNWAMEAVPRTTQLSLLLSEIAEGITQPSRLSQIAILDGLPRRRCLELLPPETVQSLGAFFTPSRMARRLTSHVQLSRSKRIVAFDPACGAGDLLLPIAYRLPVLKTVSATLRSWAPQLTGCDVSPEFVAAFRLRLVLLATSRGAVLDGPPIEMGDLLSGIFVGDGLCAEQSFEAATHVLMNPPFGSVKLRTPLEWRQGSTTAAALFLAKAAKSSKPGAEIAAILPEVLRTGTSYALWRRELSAHLLGMRRRSLGLFSADADIDVFMLRATVSSTRIRRPGKPRPSLRRCTVNDLFSIRVGPVVPHRHRESGPRVAFLHARNAAPWARIKRITERRNFMGTLLAPPFVVIRRTSRPGDPHRAIASLVTGKRPVAVENHLLVASPHCGTIGRCRQLITLLRSAQTSKLLDKTMRCRHLTVRSVSTITWT